MWSLRNLLDWGTRWSLWDLIDRRINHFGYFITIIAIGKLQEAESIDALHAHISTDSTSGSFLGLQEEGGRLVIRR